MISKLERVTDECDLMEGRTSGSSEGHEDEYATCIDDVDDSGKVQECAESPRLMDFQVEPGHYDFMGLSKPYSKPFSSSEQGSRHSSTDSGSSTIRKYSATNVESSRMMMISGTKSANQFNSVVEARRQVVTPTSRTVIIQPLLASYIWSEVECMIKAGTQHLGKGGFGDVYKGKLPNGKFVAIKVLNDGSRQGDAEFINEVNLLSTVNHRNLVKLLGYCQEGNHRVLVYEYAEEGDIYYHIHGDGPDLDWRTRLKISMEAATGLEYLHTGCSQMIVHRDIKSNNILLTKNLDAKVADFGLSKMGPVERNANTPLQFDTLVKGTPGYLDPAYSKTGKLDERSDIYSFGIVLLELITGCRPKFCATSDPSNLLHIKDWVIDQTGLKLTVDAKSDAKLKKISDPKLDGKFNLKSMREVLTLALKCVDDDPKKRPDIRIVVAQLRAATVHEDNTSHASKWSLRSLLGRTSL